MTFPHRLSASACSLPFLLCCVVSVSAEAPVAKEPAKVDKYRVYIGTYTGGKSASKGIYRCELDLSSGKLSAPVLAAETASPSFLAIHPSNRFLYAVGETGDFGGKKSGAVCAFALDPKTGELKLLNRKPSSGVGPCHLIVDRAGKHVLVANYGGGNASVLPIAEDGQLGEKTGFVQHAGTGTDPARQEAPHAHSINLDAANHFAFVADLGLDRVLIYRYDAEKGHLLKHEAFAVAAKSGPRHFALHPNGKYAYVINELANTVTAMKYDAERGSLEKIQTVSTLPKGYKGTTYTAEVQVHPSGKFLYGSNRGHNSIAIFTIDAKTGRLTPAGHQAAGIKTPRNFGIDPAGQFMLVANQDSDSILVFRINQGTGALEATGQKVEVPRPVCVKFVPKTS